jgi:hypothetical protein
MFQRTDIPQIPGLLGMIFRSTGAPRKKFDLGGQKWRATCLAAPELVALPSPGRTAPAVVCRM